LPKLQEMGYDGIFQEKHRSNAARWNGGLPDGCAIFWNTLKIDMVEEVKVGYSDGGSPKTNSLHALKGWEECKKNGRTLYRKYEMKDGKKSYKEEYVANTSGIHERASQVALALKLKFKLDDEQRRKLGRDGREFLVMTAHLASGNKLEDMPTKRYQGQQVANIIAEQNKAHNLPVIFACDFNNAPGGPTHKGFFGTLNDNLGKNPVTSAYASMLQYRNE